MFMPCRHSATDEVAERRRLSVDRGEVGGERTAVRRVIGAKGPQLIAVVNAGSAREGKLHERCESGRRRAAAHDAAQTRRVMRAEQVQLHRRGCRVIPAHDLRELLSKLCRV